MIDDCGPFTTRASTVIALPPRVIPSFTVVPGAFALMIFDRSSGAFSWCPSAERIWSHGRSTVHA